jgi:hypothetical protein
MERDSALTFVDVDAFGMEDANFIERTIPDLAARVYNGWLKFGHS